MVIRYSTLQQMAASFRDLRLASDGPFMNTPTSFFAAFLCELCFPFHRRHIRAGMTPALVVALDFLIAGLWGFRGFLRSPLPTPPGLGAYPFQAAQARQAQPARKQTPPMGVMAPRTLMPVRASA